MTRKRVLHVDDDPYWLGFVRLALAPVEEIELLSFDSLAQAQEAAREGVFDLFIVDGNIDEKGDGWDWGESLRKEGRAAYIFSTVKQSLPRFQIAKSWDDTPENFKAIVLGILGIQ